MTLRHVWAFVCGLTAFALVNAPVASAQEVVRLVPNLVARPASSLSVVVNATNGHPLLRFSATSWNNGLGPLELVPGGASSNGQDVYQRLYSSDGNFEDIWAGTFTYHPTHNHIHFNDFARYELIASEDAPGNEQTSSKTSFCVMDTTQVDLSLTGAPSSPVYSECTRVKQGMSVGWGDTYGSSLPGQSFDVNGMPAGDYNLTIISDPQNRLEETDETDNVSCIRIRLNPTARTVSTLGTCGNVTISSMTPNTIKPGESITVTIAGSGFAQGMAIGFENGSGNAPTIVVQTLNSNQITARVSVKKGGNVKGVRVWDLRVGGGVLARALTIAP